MKELSVFIDESGDFGEVTERPAYYLVTFVFHNQDNDIDQHVTKLEESIKNAVFSIQFSNVEFRKAEPQRYRLLQAADFICSLELIKIKRDEKRLSKSEEQFFYKPQELKKTFLKSIAKKKL